MGRRGWLIVALVVVIAVVGGEQLKIKLRPLIPADLPEFKPQAQVRIHQNWDLKASAWFHHADQGTQTVPFPLEWLVALKQPDFLFPGMFWDKDYLDRYGFIPAEGEETNLPIGFATGQPFRDSHGAPAKNPASGKEWTRVGFTCAACHTGRVEFGGKAYLIDGGPAMTNLVAFQGNLAAAMGQTLLLPWRLHAFEDAVLGDRKASDDLRKQLDDQVKDAIGQVIVVGQHEAKVAPGSVVEGYGRLDALTRIGNTVFALDMEHSADKETAALGEKNFVSETAPVHFPRIWDTFWFGWVQYDGSIQQPLVRNVGESLGVDAWINLGAPGAHLYSSDSKIPVVFEMEKQLAGKLEQPEKPDPTVDHKFHGLWAPRYTDTELPVCSNSEIKGPGDECKSTKPDDAAYVQRVAHGKQLYAEHCASCHLAPITSDDFWHAPGWQKPDSMNGRFLDLEMIPVEHIGTDPSQAKGLAERTVTLPSYIQLRNGQKGTVPFGAALGDVVESTIDFWMAHNTPPADRDTMNGFRPNGIRAPLAYKVRPLDGVWAAPPYLHNASVPTVFDLLSPVSERPKDFCLGTREYDPLRLGLKVVRQAQCPSGQFHLIARDQTSEKPGNSNSGHEFSDAFNTSPRPGGVIGPALTVQDRLDLIEYLKTDEVNGQP